MKGRPLRFIHGHNAERTPNCISVDGCAASIGLRTTSGEIEALIDSEDVSKLEHLTWGLRNGYAYHHSSVGGKRISFYLHEFILDRVGVRDGLVVDHINRAPLDNRKQNLRVVTQSINAHNMVKRNITGLRGASPCKRGTFVSQVKVEYRTIPLGRFKTPEEAHETTMRYLNEHGLVP